MADKKRPHIIILNPDEMRASTLGHLGDQTGATPILDQFAKDEAVSFSNAYCQNPVCVPSRCATFTGLYPHTRGHRTMSYLLREGEPTLFSELREAGYEVWANSRNDLIAGQIDGLVAKHIDTEYCYMAPKGQGGGRPQGGAKEHPYSHFEGVKESATLADQVDTDGAIAKIKNHSGDKPLCLFLGWTNPHTPYACSKEHYDRIDPAKLPDRIRPEGAKNKAYMLDRLREENGMSDYTEEQWQELRRVYMAQCAYVDDMFGQICDALREAGMYDDSLIVFWSDHGDFAGDYGIPEKDQNTFEDCLVKVPFIIKPPKGEKVDTGVSHSLAELIDLYSTVMDYAGVEPGHDAFGKSLRTVIEDRNQTVRAYAYCEGGRLPNEPQCSEYSEREAIPGSPYYARQMAQRDDKAHAKGTMITDNRYKYVKRLGGDDEFYDLEADPNELINLIPEGLNEVQENALNKMKAAMLDWYQETCDTVPRDMDNRFSEEKQFSFVYPICKPEAEAEMREYIHKHHPGFAELFKTVFELNQKYS